MKTRFIILVCCILMSASSVVAQTTIETDTLSNTTIINHHYKTRYVNKIVRDTIYLQPVEEYVKTAEEHLTTLNSMTDELTRLESDFKEAKKEVGMIKVFSIILLILLATLVACFVVLVRKLITYLEAKAEPAAPAEGTAEVPEVSEVGPIPPAAPMPSLNAYNSSVHKFITLNDNIASLRKKDNKPLIQAMYGYLSCRSSDADGLLARIRECEMPVEFKEQFVSLVSEMKAFMSFDKPIIDAWLASDPDAQIKDYASAVRMPAGMAFNPELDEDVLGDDQSGMQVMFVFKLGYYFPGNTIKPYRQKSTVAC